MDGDNNTTVFNDSSVNNCGIMVLGDAKISTAQSVLVVHQVTLMEQVLIHNWEHHLI